MAGEFNFLYDVMIDCAINSNTEGENAYIYCRESDADMYELAKMEVRAEIPNPEGFSDTVKGFYGAITDKLWKKGFRW